MYLSDLAVVLLILFLLILGLFGSVLQLRAIFLVDLEIVELVFYEALGLGGVVEQTLSLEQFVFRYAHLHAFFGFFFLD